MTISGIDLKKQTHALLTELCDVINNDDLEKFKKFSPPTTNMEGLFEEIHELVIEYCSGPDEPPFNIQPAPLDLFLEKYDSTGDNLIQFYFRQGNKDKDRIIEDEWQYSDGEWNIECSLFIHEKEINVTLRANLFYSDNKLRLQYSVICF